MKGILSVSARYKLITLPQVDVGEFNSLRLPTPDSVNSGGYLVPDLRNPINTIYIYSPIDLLIAGLESSYRGQIVDHLAKYFDSTRVMFAEDWVYLHIKNMHTGQIFVHSVASAKRYIILTKDTDMVYSLKRNAPLTFKWGVSL